MYHHHRNQMNTEQMNEVTMPLIIVLLGVIGTLLKMMWSSLGKKIDNMEGKVDQAISQIGSLNVTTATMTDRMEHVEATIKEHTSKLKYHDSEFARIKERHVRNHPGDTFD